MLSTLHQAGLVLFGVFSAFASASQYSNPLKTSSGGDPHITYDQGYYYMMATTSMTGKELTMTRATTVEGLKTGETRTVWTDSNPDRCCNMWAPEMHKIGDDWHIYYTASSSTADNHRMHVIRGDGNLWDNFSFLGTINTPDWAIDGTLLNLPGGNYFVYSCHRSDTGTSLQSLCIALHTDPITIQEEHLLSSPTASWETVGFPVNEGPYQLHYQNQSWITFSASFCGTNSYAVGLLTWTGNDPLQESSWVKHDGPVYTEGNGVLGVGHSSFFYSPDGLQTFFTHHSTPDTQGNCDVDRYVNTKLLLYDDDFKPVFGTPFPYGEEHDEPW